MKYTKFHISEIPFEEVHEAILQRLVKPEYLTTTFLESFTREYLPIGKMFDWHNHVATDEVFIVTQGQGKFYYRDNDIEGYFDYKVDDVIIAPANLFYKIVPEENVETQGFFFRIKAKEETTHSLHFMQRNIKDIPFEPIHGAPNTRQTLVTTDVVASDYLEAITKGTLRPEDRWAIHEHKDTDEIGVVLKGHGKWIVEDESIPYVAGDVIIVQGNILHGQVAEGDGPTEFFFIRVKAK